MSFASWIKKEKKKKKKKKKKKLYALYTAYWKKKVAIVILQTIHYRVKHLTTEPDV